MEKLELQKIANEVRKDIVTALHSAKAGHPGGSLSAADVFTYLYFEEMNIDPKDPKKADRDRFVLSKGHTAPGYYSALAERGFFPKEDLKTLRHLGSYLQGHPDMKHIPGVDMSSGSLGQGISAAVGMALSAKLSNESYRVYTLLGDGEIQEGQVWEAAMFAGFRKLDNLVVIVDNNGLQIDGKVDEVCSPYPIDKKFEAFNFHVINVADGNDMDQLRAAFEEAKTVKGQPTAIIAKTVKGKGVSFMENSVSWHGVAPKWALDIDPDLGIGSRYFTKYDIDNPNIRRFWETTFKSTIPLMKGKAYTDMGYILSNEPHWFSMQKTWATGVISKYTMEKFRVWLKNKHGNIAHLNKLWNTSFSSFDEVEFQVPFAVNLKGKPAGYDWMSFNMDRVTEWFKFLDSGIKKYDSDAKTHLKIMPHLFSDDKIDHGIDMEALTKLSDIIGNDAKIVKKQWNHRKEKEYWEGVYSFDWKEVTMTYDFCRSVSPNKPNVNSESHYLSSSQYRNLYMTPDFVRSAYWLATLHGMNVNYTWFWAREKDGAIRKDLMNYRGPDNAMNNAYAASVVQQPRVANEVAKTMMDLNAFSSEIAAMQSLKQPIRLFYSKTSVINKWFHMQNLFDLYRKMYFNGVPLGFATEDIINSQKNNLWELIVVSKTEFVTDAEFNSIQKYLDNGGTVIIDSVSLKKNEYGQPRNISLNASKGKLIPMDGIGKITNEAFRILEQKKLTPDVFIVEKNGINTKGCMWRVVPTGNNKYVMSIINLGCTDATVTLKSKKGNIKNVVNLINGTSLGQQFTLTPEKTILIEIQK